VAAAPVFLSALGLVNALGRGKAGVARGLFAGDAAGMVLQDGWLPDRAVRVGAVPGDLPAPPAALAAWDCRTHRLILAALEEIQPEVEAELARHGPGRVGVVLGTSTAGVDQLTRVAAGWLRDRTRPPGFRYEGQEIGAPARFLARVLGLRGPACTVSTACTSSGKALAVARDLIALGLCDAVLAGGADGLCALTLAGFTALGAATAEPCNPMSVHRKGINIGEGAALFLVRRAEAGVALLGVGESSDAYHISSPDPEGAGAEAAMRAALGDAGLAGPEVGYLNLHATGTDKNDEMESRAVARVFPGRVPCGGTKALTGHLLGAAAATELGFCWLALDPDWNPERRLPPHRWDGAPDPALPDLALVPDGARDPGLRVCLSNAFAFGGGNLALAAGRP
jgi:3-oxoacyl-[acyl-carrier-protein] synthase-1